MKRYLRMLRFLAAAATLVTAGRCVAMSAGLPPGQHTAQPKYWRVLDRNVTNYTPLDFGYTIENLTPTRDGGLWFSVGSSIGRIDANGRMTHYVMPYDLWRVSDIAQVGGDTWFSAGQSGKVGKIDSQRRLTFVQVVPRRFFPDIHDIVIKPNGEMWFVDAGRRSIGHRSAFGHVVELPVPDDAWPVHMKHCMGRLWLTADTPTTSRLAVVDENLHVHWFASNIPKLSMLAGMTCDSRDRLWLSLNSRSQSGTPYAARVDSRGDAKMFEISAKYAGDIASDANGGVWISLGISALFAPGLAHVTQNDVNRTYALPTQSYSPGAIAVGPDGSIWVSMEDGNSPISIVRLQAVK